MAFAGAAEYQGRFQPPDGGEKRTHGHGRVVAGYSVSAEGSSRVSARSLANTAVLISGFQVQGRIPEQTSDDADDVRAGAPL